MAQHEKVRKNNSQIPNHSRSLRPKKDELTESVDLILQKMPELRSNQDNLILNKFIYKSTFFTNLVECFSNQVAKSVLRFSHIHEIDKNKLIAKKGHNVERLILFLSGTSALVEAQTSQHERQDESMSSYLHEMLQKSTNIARDLKRKIKEGKEDPNSLAEFKTTKVATYEMNIIKKFEDEQLFNIKALLSGNKHTETLITLRPSVILSVSAKIFYEILATFSKKQKTEKISAFRKFQYFNNVQTERMIKLVGTVMPMVTMKKGKFLFQEGDPAKQFYLLISGGVKLSKKVDLFKENPNNFIRDRQSLKGGEADLLPYADFTEVFNYQPRTKVVELGVTSEMGIFGEEELYSASQIRQTNAQVATQTATFYVVDLQKLQQFLIDKKNFISELKQKLFKNQTENKILYHQEKLAELIMCENKNNMDYFYLEDGAKMNVSRKYKIKKVNSIISPDKKDKKKDSNSVTARSSINSALYNTFNFTKLPRSARVSASMQPEMTAEESRILDLIHMSQSSKPKSSSELRRNKIKSSKNFSIDIKNPLFELGYFEKKRKEELRIDKESRMRPLGSSSKKSRMTTSRNYFMETS